MIVNRKKMLVLETVANGGTFRDAAVAAEVSPSRARNAFYRICREIGITADPTYVRANPVEVLSKLDRARKIPANKLPKKLRGSLIAALRIKSAEELTPELVAKVSGPKLLHAHGFGPGALVEIQGWLKEHGLALRTCAPVSAQEQKDVEHAAIVLKVYGIDVALER